MILKNRRQPVYIISERGRSTMTVPKGRYSELQLEGPPGVVYSWLAGYASFCHVRLWESGGMGVTVLPYVEPWTEGFNLAYAEARTAALTAADSAAMALFHKTFVSRAMIYSTMQQDIQRYTLWSTAP